MKKVEDRLLHQRAQAQYFDLLMEKTRGHSRTLGVATEHPTIISKHKDLHVAPIRELKRHRAEHHRHVQASPRPKRRTQDRPYRKQELNVRPHPTCRRLTLPCRPNKLALGSGHSQAQQQQILQPRARGERRWPQDDNLAEDCVLVLVTVVLGYRR